MPDSTRPIVEAVSADLRESAVLIYGPRKAGTTLLQNLLDSDRETFVYPCELKLKYFVKRQLMQPGAGARYLRRSRIINASVPRFDHDKYSRGLEALAKSDKRGLKTFVVEDLELVMASLRSRLSPRLQWWCAKEAGGSTDRILQWWLSSFQNGRVILIFRNPKMITRAVLRDRRRQGRKPSLAKIFYETADPLRAMKQQCAYINDPRVFAVVYEDLVKDTSGAMARIADFLSVPFHSNLTVPTIFGEPVIVATASRASKEVFREQVRWFDKLTWRERIAVQLFSASYFLFGGFFSYKSCLRALKARGNPPGP